MADENPYRPPPDCEADKRSTGFWLFLIHLPVAYVIWLILVVVVGGSVGPLFRSGWSKDVFAYLVLLPLAFVAAVPLVKRMRGRFEA